MEIKFDNLGTNSDRTDVEADIFGEGFPVENMDQPEKFIPRYQNNINDETSCVEDCSVCCGNICICFAYPFACCCCKCSCVHELATSNVGIVEEFGKFKRLLKPGFNMINPCTEEVAEVDMRIKLLDAGQHPTITKDNVKVVIKASLAYRITNPIISYYVLRQSLNKALIELCTASLRTVVGNQILDEVLTNRSKIAGGAKAEVMRNIPPGIQVDRIFMEQIIIPPQTEKDLTSAARQRRISEANIINSKADVETASLMKQSAELLDTKAAMQIRYLEMVQELGERGVVLMMEIGARKKGYKN